MIMPGMVRYEVDLGKLTQRDVTWDAASNTLGVRLPPVEADQPQIDLAAIRQYGSGGVLMTLTSAERSEEHTSELQSLMRISYAVFCLKKKKTARKRQRQHTAHSHRITSTYCSDGT